MRSVTQEKLRAPSIPRRLDWGIALAVAAALISGLAVYLNAFAVKQLPDAAVYTTLKNGVAALMLIGFTVVLGGLREARTIERRRWPAILLVGVVGGSVPFVLFFSGLALASAPTAAFIQKTLFIWVAFLAVPALGETLGLATLAGLALLLVGQALVLPPAGIAWGAGETMILAATLLWAVETVLVRHLLGGVSGHLMAALRMGVGVVILAGYVATWFGALRRAPATVVTSVLVLGAVVTGMLTAATKGTPPTLSVVVGYALIVSASALIVAWARPAARRVADAMGAAPPGAETPFRPT